MSAEKKVIKGSKCYLRPIEESDTDRIVSWRNSAHVHDYLCTSKAITRDDHQKWCKTMIDTGKCVQYIIIENASALPAGTVFIKNIDYQNSKAEFGIFIGEKSMQGKGLASEATQLVLAYAFECLKLNKIYLNVLANNANAIKIYQKVGFSQAGLLKEDIKKDNGYIDIVYMEFLRKHYLINTKLFFEG